MSVALLVLGKQSQRNSAELGQLRVYKRPQLGAATAPA